MASFELPISRSAPVWVRRLSPAAVVTRGRSGEAEAWLQKAFAVVASLLSPGGWLHVNNRQSAHANGGRPGGRQGCVRTYQRRSNGSPTARARQVFTRLTKDRARAVFAPLPRVEITLQKQPR
jgi:hypothetical protein